MKMLTAVLMLTGSVACAQSITSQVIVPSGNNFSNDQVSLSFSVGQSIAGMITNGAVLEQGFQVDLSSTQPVVTGIEEGDTEITVFPNPAEQSIQVKISSAKHTFHFRLFDASGKEIQEKTNINEPVSEFDMHELKPAVYFLTIREPQGKTRTISIVKK